MTLAGRGQRPPAPSSGAAVHAGARAACHPFYVAT